MGGLHRRGFVGGVGAAGLAALLLPSLARAGPLNGQTVQTWRDQPLDKHQVMTKTAHDAGFRTLSLSISGDPADPRYVAVMVKLPTLIETRQFDKLSAAQYAAQMAFQKNAGWYPFIVSATGTRAAPTYAAVFSQFPALPAHDMTAGDFAAANTAWEANKGLLIWAEAYAGVGEETRYVAVWAANLAAEAWNCEATDEGLPDLQNRFDATYAGWGRAAHVAPTPSGGHLMMFTDSTLGANSAWGKMDLAQYDAKTAEQAKGGLYPLHVCATGKGADTRYAAVYAGRDDTDTRTFKPNSKQPANGFIDQVMKNYLAANGLRGCSLAVTVGPRLIYASGYTQCEADYPAISPTTPMRLASVSKIFTAAAIWKLIQEKPDKIQLNTPVQQILGLKTLSGGGAAAGWDAITVQNLLESLSGLDQSLIMDSRKIGTAPGMSLPVTREQMASYVAANAPSGTGSTWAYGNLDYFLLGKVVAALCGASSMEDALGPLMLDKLGSGAHGSRSLMAEQPADDARHHLRVFDLTQALPLKPLDTGPSLRTSGQPIVPAQYGFYDYEMYSSSGGLSASAIQVARLLAAVSVRGANPVFSDDTLDAWLNAAAAATASHPGAHGFHGFDGCAIVDAANDVWSAVKGGWLVSHESTATMVTGGYGVVLLNNGNLDPSAKFDWVTPLANIFGPPVNWAGIDNWGAFGLDPFPVAKSKKLHKPSPRAAVMGLPRFDPKALAAAQRKAFTDAVVRSDRRRGVRRSAVPIRH